MQNQDQQEELFDLLSSTTSPEEAAEGTFENLFSDCDVDFSDELNHALVLMHQNLR